MEPQFVLDNTLLWLQVPRVGTPSVWQPGVDYQLGDVIIPTDDTGLETVMFQCVGFLGQTGAASPTFPTTIGSTFVDGNVRWTARDPEASPGKLDNSEYFLIDQEVNALADESDD